MSFFWHPSTQAWRVESFRETLTSPCPLDKPCSWQSSWALLSPPCHFFPSIVWALFAKVMSTSSQSPKGQMEAKVPRIFFSPLVSSIISKQQFPGEDGQKESAILSKLGTLVQTKCPQYFQQPQPPVSSPENLKKCEKSKDSSFICFISLISSYPRLIWKKKVEK